MSIEELQPGDPGYDKHAEMISALALGDAIQGDIVDSEQFAHGGHIQIGVRRIASKRYVLTATSTDGFSSWLTRWLLNRTGDGPLLTRLQRVTAKNTVTARRKLDSGDEVDGIAVVVAHDGSTTKTLELAETEGDDSLLPAQPDFSDVPAGSELYDAAMWARRRGIIGGYSDNSFRPGATLTRGQFALMLYRALGK